ncbi:MAG: immunogenic protein [Oscillospiraceae bacterium]|nr:immunogenic protein [Oscillospiraceae bacterium]
MKKIRIAALAAILFLLTAGCGEAKVKNTIEGFRTYDEMTDGTWVCEGCTYQYRLVIRGRLNAAACDSEYVYLSNIPDISFDQAWKASGLSSNSQDYFSKEDAVLVEMNTVEPE